MTHDTSRKRFLAKVLGLATVGALVPRAVAKAVAPDLESKKSGKRASFRLQPQDRAVAREDSA